MGAPFELDLPIFGDPIEGGVGRKIVFLGGPAVVPVAEISLALFIQRGGRRQEEGRSSRRREEDAKPDCGGPAHVHHFSLCSAPFFSSSPN